MSPSQALFDDYDPAYRLGSWDVAPGSWKANTIHVLLVEDDDVDAKLIDLYAARLTDPKVVIARAVSAGEARGLLAERTFDLCILDFWLGCESSLRLMAEIDDVVLPTLVLTSLSTPDIDRMCQRAGASLFIGKEGLSPASLQTAILAALRATARPRTPVEPLRTGRVAGDGGRTSDAAYSAYTPGFAPGETREDAMARVLADMLGVPGGAARRDRGDVRFPGRGFSGAMGFDRAQVDLSASSRQPIADPRWGSLLVALLDMTETVRFGLFEKALTTPRPPARKQAGEWIDDAGDFIASAIAIAHGVFDDRGQTVSFHGPESAVAVLCDPATFLFVIFELVVRASQQSASNRHIVVSLDVGGAALHISFVSDQPTHAHASALAFGPLFLQILGESRGVVHNVSGDDGLLRLACRVEADEITGRSGRPGHAIRGRGLSSWAPPGRTSDHHPNDAD